MHRIYAKCNLVQVWLGEAWSSDYSAFDLFKKTWKFFSTLALQEEEGSRHPRFDMWEACRAGILPSMDSSECSSVASLLGKRWFSRVWVVQEVVMGSQISVRCGRRKIGWSILEEFVAGLLVSGLASIPQLRLAHKAIHMVLTTSHIKNRIDANASFSTIDVFSNTRKFNATDSRDKYYGLMGVIKNEAALVQPDYDSPANELLTRRAAYSLVMEKTFDCLSFADPDSLIESIPSWVPDWHSLSKERCPLLDHEVTQHGAAHFEAAVKPHRPPRVSLNLGILTLDGLQVDVLSCLGHARKDQPSEARNDLIIRGMIQQLITWLADCYELAENVLPYPHSSQPFLECFWRTVVCNTSSDGTFTSRECNEHYHILKGIWGILSDATLAAAFDRGKFEEMCHSCAKSEQAINLWGP